MEEENLSALYDILKEQNVFSSREAMDAFIEKEGVAKLYSFMPEGFFTDEAAFLATFSNIKKKRGLFSRIFGWCSPRRNRAEKRV